MIVTIEQRHWSNSSRCPVETAILEQCIVDEGGVRIDQSFGGNGLVNIWANGSDVSALYIELIDALDIWERGEAVPSREFQLDVWLKSK